MDFGADTESDEEENAKGLRRNSSFSKRTSHSLNERPQEDKMNSFPDQFVMHDPSQHKRPMSVR